MFRGQDTNQKFSRYHYRQEPPFLASFVSNLIGRSTHQGDVCIRCSVQLRRRCILRAFYNVCLFDFRGEAMVIKPTHSALEAHIAKLTGKEAGVFMTSGTMSNQIALRTHLKQPPYSILCDHRAHINKYVVLHARYLIKLIRCRYEAGGAAFHSGAAVTTVIPSNGKFPG